MFDNGFIGDETEVRCEKHALMGELKLKMDESPKYNTIQMAAVRAMRALTDRRTLPSTLSPLGIAVDNYTSLCGLCYT